MHIGVLMLIKIPKRVENRARLLRSRSAIEINQRMTMRPFAQDREIFAKSSPIGGATGKLVHSTICYTRRSAPVYLRKLKETLGNDSQHCEPAFLRTFAEWRSQRSVRKKWEKLRIRQLP
jgi:hypothetical protein